MKIRVDRHAGESDPIHGERPHKVCVDCQQIFTDYYYRMHRGPSWNEKCPSIDPVDSTQPQPQSWEQDRDGETWLTPRAPWAGLSLCGASAIEPGYGCILPAGHLAEQRTPCYRVHRRDIVEAFASRVARTADPDCHIEGCPRHDPYTPKDEYLEWKRTDKAEYDAARTADPGGLRLAIETTRAYGVSIGWAGGPGDAVSEVLHRLEALASETTAPEVWNITPDQMRAIRTADPGGLLRDGFEELHRIALHHKLGVDEECRFCRIAISLASETTAPARSIPDDALRMVEAVARGLAEPDGLTRSEAADALRAALASETTAPDHHYDLALGNRADQEAGR